MAARIAVPVRLVEGGHQAICETANCTAGLAGGPWRSEIHSVKAGALEEARVHRQWHRAQRPVPAEPLPTWAKLTTLGGSWRIEFFVTANGVHLAGTATGHGPDPAHQLLTAMETLAATPERST
ncbi:hypothetical protein AB0I81_22575 [Nonomuraea sp. NPDC050404]|uniref:hypothetical protein n=1 Tax=Nonomuraea sp. NPDC050404 TaxID=3155783 RepID=UPI0033D39FF2